MLGLRRILLSWSFGLFQHKSLAIQVPLSRVPTAREREVLLASGHGVSARGVVRKGGEEDWGTGEDMVTKGRGTQPSPWFYVSLPLDRNATSSSREPRKTRSRQPRVKRKRRSMEHPPVPEGYDRKVSMTLMCIIVLSGLSVVMYVALAVARNADEMAGCVLPSVVTDMLGAAARSIYYPPILACIFVACRLHVLANTNGLGEPQAWVKVAMAISTCAMVLQYVCVICLSLVIVPSEVGPFSEQVGGHFDVHPRITRTQLKHDYLRPLFIALQAFVMSGIYGGAAVVIYGMFVFDDGSPGGTEEPSPSLTATAVLASIYISNRVFVWSGGIRHTTICTKKLFKLAMGPSWNRKSGELSRAESDKDETRWSQVAVSMAFSAQKAPLLALLFMTARLRAMECDPWNGKPPWWVREVFGYITISLFIETIIAGMIGYYGQEEEGYYHTIVYRCQSRVLHVLLHIANGLTGFWTWLVIGSIFAMDTPASVPSKPFPPSLCCILFLTVMYLLVHGSHYLILLLKHVFDSPWPLIEQTVIAAQASVHFTPVLGVLFLAVRMRAVQVTNHQGGPQNWAQDAMYLCCFACLVQAACCIALPSLTGHKSQFDEGGNATYDLGPLTGAYVVTTIKYFVLASLVITAGVVFYSVFDISPDTANYGKHDSIFAYIKDGGILFTLVLVAMFLSSPKVIGHAVKTVIESVPNEILGGCEVHVQKAVLSIFHGYVNVVGIKMTNPKTTDSSSHFLSSYILEIENVVVKLSVWNLIKSRFKHVELDLIAARGVYLTVEKAGCSATSNLGVLKKALKRRKKMRPKEEKDTRIIVHKLEMRELGADLVKNDSQPFMRIRLAPVVINALDSKDDVSEIVVQFVSALIGSASVSGQLLRITANLCSKSKEADRQSHGPNTPDPAGSLPQIPEGSP
eukprot:TRINITY_DN33651_c0_g1_i1.p1 TRINITY_DN33651_c0_g1~~TRINITY_DN33651_c0_g1_i1.p1  ORF type:complete len:975 (+),score=145.55 TRINITY_DN33651_c0_g1_i1:181-2925(+)